MHGDGFHIGLPAELRVQGKVVPAAIKNPDVVLRGNREQIGVGYRREIMCVRIGQAIFGGLLQARAGSAPANQTITPQVIASRGPQQSTAIIPDDAMGTLERRVE